MLNSKQTKMIKRENMIMNVNFNVIEIVFWESVIEENNH